MKKPASVDAYIADAPTEWQAPLNELRSLMHRLGLDEAIKWAFPTFMLDGKNVAALYVNKQYAGVWFFQGALLLDPDGLLHNAQEGKTQAMRQLRFDQPKTVDITLTEQFLREAMENERQGLRVKMVKPTFDLARDTPPELRDALSEQPDLKAAFLSLTPSKQREYCEHISGAKRADTKTRRLDKITPMILAGVGLSDKYR